jgi:hypothetical protein
MTKRATNDPVVFARLCAFMGWDLEENIKALVEDYRMTEADARELMSREQRARDEVDIENTHDDILEGGT